MSAESITPALVLSEVNESARGPTPFSHWVIPKLLLASAYPGEKNPDDNQIRTRQVIDAGVQVIVNMMEEEELKKCTSYQDTMRQHASKVNREIEFISFPIRDRFVHPDNQCLLDFCLELCDRIKRGQVLLIHCLGGHGRTGIIASIIIGIVGDLNSEDAMSMNHRLHAQRVNPKGYSSPETGCQTEQVRTVLDEMYRKSEIYQKNKKKNFMNIKL